MTVILIFFMSLFVHLSPEQVVQQNLECYNKRDIDCFMSFFTEDVSLHEFGQPVPLSSGKDEIRKRYTELFAKSPQLHSVILSRMVIGNKVIDHERITGRNGSNDPVELVMIYEVMEEKIVRMTVIRK